MMTANTEIFTDQRIDEAYEWLCKQRAHFPPNADIWHLRFHWATIRPQLLHQLCTQNYQLSPMSSILKADGKIIHLWSALDALVLKVVAGVLPQQVSLHGACTHIKGHGGLKGTVRHLQQVLPDYKFVMKTDVKGYYASIDHTILLKQLAMDISSPFLFRLLYQYVKRTVENGGIYKDIQSGIARGSALSPVIGAYCLTRLDEALSKTDLHYARYMDDIVILAKTRWRLRRAIKTLNQMFNVLKLKQHPDKTFVGRIERGFDFLGYHFSHGPLMLATKTMDNMLVKMHRLYEQKKTASPDKENAIDLGAYWRRWWGWVRGGLDNSLPSTTARPLVGLQRSHKNI